MNARNGQPFLCRVLVVAVAASTPLAVSFLPSPARAQFVATLARPSTPVPHRFQGHRSGTPRAAAGLPVEPPQPMTAARSTSRSAAPAVVTSYSLAIKAAPDAYQFVPYPSAINDSGQFVGSARLNGDRTYNPHCIAWNGAAYVDFLRPAVGALGCAVDGIGDVNPKTGFFPAAGSVVTPTDYDGVATYTLVSATSTETKAFTSNLSSNLYAMNRSGVAVGTGLFIPFDATLDFIYPSALYTTAGSALALLQPACESASALYPGIDCLYDVSGKRAINTKGIVVGFLYNVTNGYEEFDTATGATFAFTLPALNPAYAPSSPYGLDDAGRVPYSAYDGKMGHAMLFNPYSNLNLDLGTIGGSTCRSYTPITINAFGEVLGYTSLCTNASDAVYWVWDATYGMRSVNAGVRLPPTHDYLIASALNDRGQILISLARKNSGAVDWGYLTPGPTSVATVAGHRTGK